MPGHHLQIALPQELGELPYFRRNAHSTAFVEGWGLYAEYLGEEMGIYRTPYERFGRSRYEMWRACRLVADTGIHWLGWDIGASAPLLPETPRSRRTTSTELERYISPGQALAYKIGELTVRRLRREATERNSAIASTSARSTTTCWAPAPADGCAGSACAVGPPRSERRWPRGQRYGAPLKASENRFL